MRQTETPLVATKDQEFSAYCVVGSLILASLLLFLSSCNIPKPAEASHYPTTYHMEAK